MLTEQDGKQQEKEAQAPSVLPVGVRLPKREGTLLLAKPRAWDTCLPGIHLEARWATTFHVCPAQLQA